MRPRRVTWWTAALLLAVGLPAALVLSACGGKNTSAPAVAPAGAAINVPTPTIEQLAQANPAGDAVQRGAAVYFALNCDKCHGAIGNAPGELRLREGGREAVTAIRQGRPGMPAYNTALLSDAQLADLTAYLGSFGGQQRGQPSGQFRSEGTPRAPEGERTPQSGR